MGFRLVPRRWAGYGPTVTSPPVYSIGAVARMLDIPPATLRTWEERYGQPVPERSPGGHRLYSRDQVDQLRFVKVQLAQGISPADAHRLLAERLDTGWLSFGAPETTTTRLLILLAERDPHAADLSEYFLRTEGYEVAAALDAADATQQVRGADPEHDRDRPAHLGRRRAGAVPPAQAAQRRPDLGRLDPGHQ